MHGGAATTSMARTEPTSSALRVVVALTSTEAIRRRRTCGGACRRAKAGGAYDRDCRHLRHRNTIAPADLGDLIAAVSRALDALGREQAEPTRPEPAVPVRSSIRDEHLTCLVCGKQQKILRRHLDVTHQGSRRKPTASSSDFNPTTPWPHPATPGSVQRWQSAWAWDSALRRHHDAGGRSTASDGRDMPSCWPTKHEEPGDSSQSASETTGAKTAPGPRCQRLSTDASPAAWFQHCSGYTESARIGAGQVVRVTPRGTC
jgi:ROS/MUCR transcriptional regulator protein